MMKDEEKTKKQLIVELAKMRRRVAELEAITAENKHPEMWQRYEFIVNASKEFLSLINHDHVYEAVNETYCRVHNKTQPEIIGKSVADLWGEGRYLSQIKPHLEACLAGQQTHYQGWFEFATLGQRYFDVDYYPYYDSAGNVTHAVVVSRDMTERK